ncbi:hypothetical protein [Stenotrophomonas sp. YIM B06876]|uniref:hypothetical protein n=1 Tax=Stenotrophomonas sp. YIM B06876 TaxID=3060211 RepID=UPI002739F2AB|nr:hypothetical protein [Stenotrophomonas sp. YIM B06876]
MISLLLAGALGWAVEPGIICRKEGQGEVMERMGPVAEGHYRLGGYGDYIPQADVFELRRSNQLQARLVHQSMGYSCETYLDEKQCPSLVQAEQALMQLSYIEKNGPAAPVWPRNSRPVHGDGFVFEYQPSGEGIRRAVYDPTLLARQPEHPAGKLIARIWQVERQCGPDLARKTQRKNYEADKAKNQALNLGVRS